MATLALMREPIVRDIKSLDEKVRSVLGYNGLYYHAQNTTLLCKLIAAGHTPFSEKSVNAYKAMKVRRAWYKKCVPSLLTACSVPILIFACVHAEGSPGSQVLLGLAALAMGIFTIARTIWTSVEYSIKWEVAGFGGGSRSSGYSKPVPVSVLQKAMDIKTAIPEASLYVDELNIIRNEHVPLDPFLFIAGNNGQRYYVAVWGEPTFEDSQVE